MKALVKRVNVGIIYMFVARLAGVWTLFYVQVTKYKNIWYLTRQKLKPQYAHTIT